MSSLAWTILGTVLTAVGLAVAVIQSFRYQEAARLLRTLRDREQIANWALYDLITQAYDQVREARDELRDESGGSRKALENAARAVSLLNAMWLNTVEHAAALEPEFSEQTLDRWEALGRLDTQWRMERARRLLPAPRVDGPQQ